MKKSKILTLFSILAIGSLLAQQEIPTPPKEVKKTYAIQKAYAYQAEALLVSDSDNKCTFFIRREPIPEDIQIIGAKRQDDLITIYSTNDLMYINAGSQNGLKEGDVLLIIGKHSPIPNPFVRGKLGTYYLKKGLAIIQCIYEDKAIIVLKDNCNPVEIGDFAIPYKPEKTIWQKKLIYSLCRIPPTPLEGKVVYCDIYVDVPGDMASTSSLVSVDLGEGLVEKGTFLLFYRVLKADLPPFIVGLGIVVHPESNNSTVKILDSYSDIRIGDRVAVLTGTNELKVEPTKKEEKKEEIPIVETLGKEAETKKEPEKKETAREEERLMIDVYFDFDTKTPPTSIGAEMEKVSNFIANKSEYVIILRGYCCSIGSDEYNLKLSQERVEAVKAMISTQYKIDPTHIETYYYGEKESPYDNSQETERKKNRLVKIEAVGR